MTSLKKKLSVLLLSLITVCAIVPSAFALLYACPYCHNVTVLGTWSPSQITQTAHSYLCTVCYQTADEAHAFNDLGVCVVCGYNTPYVSAHNTCSYCTATLNPNGWVITPWDTTTHYQNCTNCAMPNTRQHQPDLYGKCTICDTGAVTGSFRNISVTVSQTVGTYYFTDNDNYYGSSIYSQIINALPYNGGLTSASDYIIHFSTTTGTPGSLNNIYLTNCRLSDLSYVALEIKNSGTFTTEYSVTLNGATVLYGTISIVVEPYANQNILYTATLGENVALDANDFYAFWSEYSDGLGTLNSVHINSVTGLNGTLCYNHTAAEKLHTTVAGLTLYAAPTAYQKGLTNLTFVPSKVNNAYNPGTATISFTATGTRSYSASTTTTISGKILISYTKNQVTPIVYDAVSGYITLNPSDFDNVYRAVTGSSTRNPSYTIQFLNLPAYGTLHRDYSNTSFGSLLNTQLTAANIASMTFSNRSGNSNYIGNVTYVPSSFKNAADSVRYAVYSGSTLVYIGTISFNAKEIIITYSCTSSGVKFSSVDFFNTGSSLLYAQYLSFGQPSSGTLYMDYANGTGTPVTTNNFFSYNSANGIFSLDSVTFVPAAGFTGIVEIPFYSSTLTNLSVSGRVRIYVVAKGFSDVNPSSWYAPYVNRLYASGVIGGTGNNTFSPNANMKYGEALKMILVAAGYPKQSETGGSHWASNYLSLAYRNGIVSSTSIDLNALVDRNTVAELAAKAMGLASASSINAGIAVPSDSTNGYVYALYNAGIVGGEYINGVNYFHGTRNISRAEVAKIICTIMDYKK